MNLYIPKEKRYQADSIKNENILIKKVIPKGFTIWNIIDIFGPNNIYKDNCKWFKGKYNIDIDYKNHKDYILASPIDGDEGFNKLLRN